MSDTVSSSPAPDGASSTATQPDTEAPNNQQRPAIIFWALMAGAAIPFLIPYFLAAWNQEHFQYIPLVLVAILGLAYARHDGVLITPSGRLTMSLLGVAVFFMAIAAALHSSWLGAIAVMFLTLAFLRSLRQNDGSSLLYLAMPLLLFIRLPQIRTQALIVRLQRVTTDLSSVVLDFLGVPNFVQGNTISLADKQLFVDEACSGVRSLFTLMFFALVLLVFRKRSLWLTPLVLAIGVILAVFGNMVRVTTIALAQAWFNYDLAGGFQHDLLGHGTLLLSLGLMLSADRLIEAIFHAINQEGDRANPLIRLWNFFFVESGQGSSFRGTVRTRGELMHSVIPMALKSVAGIALLLALWMTIGKVVDRLNRPNLLADGELLLAPEEDFLEKAGLEIRAASHRIHRDGIANQNERLGTNADIYTCRLGGKPGEFVISQPYVGWHELTICYRSIGWEQKSRRILETSDGQSLIYAIFKRGENEYGHLFFTGINADGSAPISLGLSRTARWLEPFIPTILDDPAETTGNGQTAMLQFWSVSTTELLKEEIDEIAAKMSRLRMEAGNQMKTAQLSS